MKTNRLLCRVKCAVWVCVATLSPFLDVDAGQVPSGGVSVSLMPSPFAENVKRERTVLMSLEPDNLTWMFRVTSGLDSLSNTNGVLRLGGWEAPGVELRGHTCGHWLSGMANVIHARRKEVPHGLSPLPEERAAAEVVHQLRLCQDAIGTGYVSAFPESFVDRVIARKRVWAPWYTLHKILAGLIDQYTLAGNEEALLVARRFGDWAYARLSPLSENELAQMRHNEFGGIGEALRSLYAITKDPRHAKAADAFDDPTVLDALDRREDAFAPKHCNTYLPKMLADLRKYELFHDEKALGRVTYFFDRALNHHMYAAGCFSDKEHWFRPDTQGAHLTGVTGESCCTYNMLKLARRLFALNPRIETADYIERAIYNHILAQQEPMEGRITYFMPMMTGSYKLRNRANDAFWCCVGSAMESQTGFANYIAQESGNALYVNLFIPSRVTWKGFTFELSETTLKCVSADANASSPVLYVREPHKGYRKVVRAWKPGDEIDVGEKWTFRMEALPDDPSHAALFYGPWLLGGCLGTEGMRRDATRSLNYYEHDYTVPEHLRDISLGDLTKVVPIKEDFDRREYATERKLAYLHAPVVFQNENGVVLKPLAWINGERWVVYWRIGQ